MISVMLKYPGKSEVSPHTPENMREFLLVKCIPGSSSSLPKYQRDFAGYGVYVDFLCSAYIIHNAEHPENI